VIFETSSVDTAGVGAVDADDDVAADNAAASAASRFSFASLRAVASSRLRRTFSALLARRSLSVFSTFSADGAAGEAPSVIPPPRVGVGVDGVPPAALALLSFLVRSATSSFSASTSSSFSPSVHSSASTCFCKPPVPPALPFTSILSLSISLLAAMSIALLTASSARLITSAFLSGRSLLSAASSIPALCCRIFLSALFSARTSCLSSACLVASSARSLLSNHLSFFADSMGSLMTACDAAAADAAAAAAADGGVEGVEGGRP